MDISDRPDKIPLPWAASAGAGYVTVVPRASQIGIANGRASWSDGFPPLNFVPDSAGGVPPFGDDMNGGMKQISAGLQWLQAGGPQSFDAGFATNIGGYPQGAIIASATTLGLLWVSTVDDNTGDPDASAPNWFAFSLQGFFPAITTVPFATPGAWTFTIPAGVRSVRVRAWGAGGGGGGVNGPGGGSGGGGGAYGEKTLLVAPGDVINGNVGAGGIAGTSGSDAGNGGNTTLVAAAVTYTLGGGVGGHSANNNLPNSVSGGSATGAWDSNVVGQPSFGGFAGYNASGPAVLYYAGTGGISFAGGWGGQGGTGAGNPGGVPGGGGGAAAASTAVNLSGSAGGGGQVLVDYYTG